MRLELFSPDLSQRHEITHAISSSFSEYYNDIGKFTVVLPMDDYNISIMELNAVLYIVERKLAYEVAEIRYNCDSNEITLNGFSLNNKLNRRIIASSGSISNVEKDVYSIVNANLRGLDILIAPEKGLSETINATRCEKHFDKSKAWKSRCLGLPKQNRDL